MGFVDVVKRLLDLGAVFVTFVSTRWSGEIMGNGEFPGFAPVSVFGFAASFSASRSSVGVLAESKAVAGLPSISIRVGGGGRYVVSVGDRVFEVGDLSEVVSLPGINIDVLDAFVKSVIDRLGTRVEQCLECVELSERGEIVELVKLLSLLRSLRDTSIEWVIRGVNGVESIDVRVRYGKLDLLISAGGELYGFSTMVEDGWFLLKVENACVFAVASDRGDEVVDESINALKRGWWAISGKEPAPRSSELSKALNILARVAPDIVDDVRKMVTLTKYLP